MRLSLKLTASVASWRCWRDTRRFAHWRYRR
jgi:hypothetical protein